MLYGCSNIERHNEWNPEGNNSGKSQDFIQCSKDNLNIRLSMSSDAFFAIGPPLVPLFPFGLIAPHDLGPVEVDLILSTYMDTMKMDLKKVSLCNSCINSPTIINAREIYTNTSGKQSRACSISDTVFITPNEKHIVLLYDVSYKMKDSIVFSIKDIHANNRILNSPNIKMYWHHNFKYSPLSFNYLH